MTEQIETSELAKELIALSKIKEDTGFPETADICRQAASRLIELEKELEKERERLDWLDANQRGWNGCSRKDIDAAMKGATK